VEERFVKNKKDIIELVLLGIITFTLVVGLVLSAIHFKKSENQKASEESGRIENIIDENSKEEGTTQKDDTDEKNKSETSHPESSSSPVVPTIPPTSSPNENLPTSSPVTRQESDVISYFDSLDVSMMREADENNGTFREKAKNTFTTVVDFLFYGSTIKGYTFKELTTSAKLKIIQIALKIDHKIDTYFSNYKDTIKEKMSNLKGKAALLYLEATSQLCESVGDSACREAREDFKNMKESFGFTWNIIKEAATSSYGSLKTILQEWYESIR